MAKRHNELLGALDVSRAKPEAKPYRLADGGGLYLWVPTTGVKVWQFRYRHGGKPQTATLGKLSTVQGLAWASRPAAQSLPADPGVERRRNRAVAHARRRTISADSSCRRSRRPRARHGGGSGRGCGRSRNPGRSIPSVLPHVILLPVPHQGCYSSLR